MLPIVLFILKLLGILALIVLGLILGVLLLILFVPVRYRLEGSFCERPKGRARITWLLHMVSVTAAYEEDCTITIRLFGFRILKPGKEIMEDSEDMVVHAMEEAGEETEIFSGESVKAAEKAKDKPVSEAESVSETPKREEPVSGQKSISEEKPEKSSKAGKAGARISEISAKLKFSFRSICDKLKTIKEKKEEIQSWILNEENQQTIKLLLRQTKKLLRHFLPRKGQGEVVFGFDDPYTTGQVLTAVSVVYPFCHKMLHIYPVFDRAVLTAEGHFKGRIRIGTLLLIMGRMLFNKNFRNLLRRWLW